jgi:curved DNA-binding protein CbpA
MKTAYDVLGVPRNASHERIRTAFRQVAKGCHPDLNAGDPTAELQIRQVITAYEILKIPHRRAAYDQHLRERRRERARHCARAAVANLLRCSVVALAVSLSASQLNTQDALALHASTPPTPHPLSVKVKPDESQQLAAGDNPRREEVNKGPKSDWGAAPEHGPRHRPDTADSLPPTAGPPELYAALARERGQASGEPMASTGHAHKSELPRSELIVLINAAAPLSSNSLKTLSLEERTTKFVSSHIASWSSTSTSDLGSLASAYADNVLYDGSRKSRQPILPEKSRELARWPERVYDVQRPANHHRYKRRITSDESPSPDRRGAKSKSRASIGSRHPLVLPGGPNELLALLVSKKLTPKTSSALPSNVVGVGGRAGSYETQQIVVPNRAEAASEKPHRVHRIWNAFEAKATATAKNKQATKLPLDAAGRGTSSRQFSERPSLTESPADECRAKPGAAGPAGGHWYYHINSVDGRRCWFLGKEGMTVRLLAPEESHRPARNPKAQRIPTETALPTPAQATPVPVAPAPVTSAPMALGASTASWGDGNSRWTDFVVRWPS